MLPRSMELNANLTKGAASPVDVLQLLRAWRPEHESAGGFQVRAIEENLLGKASRKRMLDVVKNVLARRYFPGGVDRPARHVAALDAAGLPREGVRQVMYYHAARAEHLLYRLAAELLYDLRQEGVAQVDVQRVSAWIQERAAAGDAPRWSPVVVNRVARAGLTALRDFGVLEGKAKKRVAPVRVPHEVVGYVVHALHEEGLPARRIASHPDWKLFLLDPLEAERAILEGAYHGHYTYSAAGDVRRFDWHHESLDAYVRSLAVGAAQAA